LTGAPKIQTLPVDAVDGLAQLLISSGGLASSAAATLLIALLLQRARSRNGSQPVPDGCST